jgi:group I intron endonuclease
MRYGSIYVVTNTHTQEQYVGQTIQPVSKRWAAHLYTSKNPKFKLAKAIHEYGVSIFKCEEVYVAFDKTELDNAEKSFIKQLNAVYNMTKGGSGKPDRYITEKQRLCTKKLSSERWANPEWKAKTVAAMWGNPEVRDRRIQSLKSRLADPKVRQRYRDVQLGRKMSAEAVYKSAKAKWKPIYCKELEITFLSQQAAAEELKILKTSICNAIKSKGKVAGKYTFSRVN